MSEEEFEEICNEVLAGRPIYKRAWRKIFRQRWKNARK